MYSKHRFHLFLTGNAGVRLGYWGILIALNHVCVFKAHVYSQIWHRCPSFSASKIYFCLVLTYYDEYDDDTHLSVCPTILCIL